jgi:hypothetical protein
MRRIENKETTMKMIVTESVSLDGVMQGLSGVTIQVFRPSGKAVYATSTAKASWRQS